MACYVHESIHEELPVDEELAVGLSTCELAAVIGGGGPAKLPCRSTRMVPSSNRRISGSGCWLDIAEACTVSPDLIAEGGASVDATSLVVGTEAEVGGGGPPDSLGI